MTIREASILPTINWNLSGGSQRGLFVRGFAVLLCS
jgi:hypothetical protein